VALGLIVQTLGAVKLNKRPTPSFLFHPLFNYFAHSTIFFSDLEDRIKIKKKKKRETGSEFIIYPLRLIEEGGQFVMDRFFFFCDN
jgi:hypothetical protein